MVLYLPVHITPLTDPPVSQRIQGPVSQNILSPLVVLRIEKTAYKCDKRTYVRFFRSNWPLKSFREGCWNMCELINPVHVYVQITLYSGCYIFFHSPFAYRTDFLCHVQARVYYPKKIMFSSEYRCCKKVLYIYLAALFDQYLVYVHVNLHCHILYII